MGRGVLSAACSFCLLAIEIWGRHEGRGVQGSGEAQRRPWPCAQRTAGHNRKPEGKKRFGSMPIVKSVRCRFSFCMANFSQEWRTLGESVMKLRK